MLKVEHLTKVYEGGVLALEDVSFEVPEGEFLAVIGQDAMSAELVRDFGRGLENLSHHHLPRVSLCRTCYVWPQDSANGIESVALNTASHREHRLAVLE